ncbi:hypothetical protein CEXT_271541 [Caerostris extrusa]|uniref:ZP domain-containing protein n=1 Tax=Caerostris extrusa TaxID=172846 RepID=A0AAV4RVU4_CAEEX|nr:hypothetical protein CEXT_271541 [Caerostris extrusa]
MLDAINVGKGPWANEVSGIVRIGQTMTLVLAIKDEENKFDMMVRNCIAHDGNRAPIELHPQKKEEAGIGEVREIGLNSIPKSFQLKISTFSPYKNETRRYEDQHRKEPSVYVFVWICSLFDSSVVHRHHIELDRSFPFLEAKKYCKNAPLPYDMAIFKSTWKTS